MEGSGPDFGIDQTGATVNFQSQISEVARFCARKTGEEKDVVEAESDPAWVRFLQKDTDLGNQLEQVDAAKDMAVGRGDGNSTLSTGTPGGGSGPRPEMIPVPDSPSLSVQLPLPRDTLDTPQPRESSFDRTCAPSQAARADGAQYDELTWDSYAISAPKEVIGRGNRRRS